MKLPRIYPSLLPFLKPKKVFVLYGPRQVGKTTLLNDSLADTNLKYKLVSGDDIRVQHILGSQDRDKILEYAEGYELLAIDEAQKVPGVGAGLKILVDHLPDLRVMATGSSSFELAGQIGEPLTGRKTTLTLYPVSQLELSGLFNTYELKEKLPEWLVFGGYPEVVATTGKKEKARLLEELVNSYLLKDILSLDKVKNSKVLLDLLRLLAFQIGCEVSLSELASQLAIDYKTVGRYLDLLEKSFVVYNLRGFSRNLRSEITKKSKYHFFDLGIRNAVISNFNALELRNDAGALWENFVFMERLKKRGYQDISANAYFWRTWDQKELDLVEERGGKLHGYEAKWGPKQPKPPGLWRQTYPEASFEVISRENYLRFVA